MGTDVRGGDLVMKLGGADYYSDTRPRVYLSSTILVEILNVTSSTNVILLLRGRDFVDTGWTTLATFSTITSAGVYTVDVTQMKELWQLLARFGSGDASHAAFTFGEIEEMPRPSQ